MRKRDNINWRKSITLCEDGYVRSISSIDRLYKIIKEVERKNPRVSQETYIRACEYED